MVLELKDHTGYTGEVHVLVFDGDLPLCDLVAVIDDSGHPLRSRLVSESITRNTVTNVGRQQMTKLIVGESASYGNYIGLSTSATTPSLVLTALTDEISRKACTIIASYLSYTQRKVAYFTTTDFASTGVAGEGIFDTTSTGGSMWAATSLSLSKTATQSLVVSHLITATT